MKYNNIDYQRCVLICMVVMIHIVNFSTLYPDVKNFINFFFMQAFLLITGYLVNIRKTYKEFASYIMKILIPYIIMVTGYAFVSTLLPVRDGVNEFTIPIILNTIFVTSIGPYWFLYTMAICGVIYYLTFNLVGKWSIMGKLCLFATFLMLVSQYTPVLNSLNSAALFLVRKFYMLRCLLGALCVDMRCFGVFWVFSKHKIPHPNQWGSMKNHKK